MTDIPGQDGLIATLERICREHRAMTRLLQEDNPRWRSDVLRLANSQVNADVVHSRFHEVITSQKSSPDNAIDLTLLIKALNKAIL